MERHALRDDQFARIENAMIDATIVRAHQHSAGALKKGVSIKPSAARAAVSRRKST